jgi:hypothetical protein
VSRRALSRRLRLVTRSKESSWRRSEQRER